MEYYVTRANEAHEDELYHYGVKGMKWGVRRAQKYEAKAKKYRSKADDYDPKKHASKLSDKKKNKMQVKKSKFDEKADKMDLRARIAREGKDDLKKLRTAGKLHGNYIDTQGMMRGPYADAVDSIRTQKGERYAKALMDKHTSDQINKMTLALVAGSAVYSAGMTYLINRM